jgi:tetratricopeptide (TPR) repeat protein
VNEQWDKIIEDYKTARFCLVCPKGKGHWMRQEDKGMYHLWSTYYAAINAEEKNHLFYARILSLMGWEMMHKTSNYDLLNKYYKPAVEQYELALQENPDCGFPSEIENVRWYYENYKYLVEKGSIRTEEDYQAAIELLEGYDCLNEFQFHDSELVGFECGKESAVLKLKYSEIYYFEFNDIYDIEMCCDPLTAYVSDFAIYRATPESDTIVFDIEFLKISCKRIRVHK